MISMLTEVEKLVVWGDEYIARRKAMALIYCVLMTERSRGRSWTDERIIVAERCHFDVSVAVIAEVLSKLRDRGIIKIGLGAKCENEIRPTLWSVVDSKCDEVAYNLVRGTSISGALREAKYPTERSLVLDDVTLTQDGIRLWAAAGGDISGMFFI